MFVCCECCVLSGRGLCDGLITRPEESYRLWRVVVCDQETSNTRRLKPATGLWKIQPKGCNARKTNISSCSDWYVFHPSEDRYLSYLLHGRESFLRSLKGSLLVKKFPAFYGTRWFITTSTRAFSEPEQSNPCTPSHFLKIHFNIIPIYVWVS
jgi:hypothetical protein